MAKYFRYFETIAEFESAYTGEEYVEPFVAYIEENQGVAFNKAQLLNIEIVALAMENDVPATGKTVDKNDCEYTVLGFYDDSTEKDITDEATVTGSLVVEASQIEERHSAGTLTLTATYDEFEASKSVVVFQEAFVPTLTAITLDDLTWEEDIPAEGGTATKDNCSYTVTAYYDNGNEVDVTDEAVVTGTLVVEESELEERHSAGTLTLTATYSGFSDSGSVTVWQEAVVSYLTFDILSGGNIAFGYMSWVGDPIYKTIEYKINDGEWTSLTSQPSVSQQKPETAEEVVDSFPSKFAVSAGDVVQFRGNNATYAALSGESENGYSAFFSSARFNVKGNIMSLVDKENFKTLTTLVSAGTFESLFTGCYKLASAGELILPATTLTEYCYGNMFSNLFDDMGYDVGTELTTAPSILPATTLANHCYDSMFKGCTGLTIAPALPATTLAQSCYSEMFLGCTSLTTAPALPATTLADYCYSSMFDTCEGLTTAPSILPATTLAEGCYDYMFSYCTSLTTAPELPATTLTDYCYDYMFDGCTSLNYIKCLATDISASECTTRWVNGVASTGTFVKNPNMSSWTTGTDGIPSGWTVQDA